MPALLAPDNLKSAVTRACRYERQLNITYADMAHHYHHRSAGAALQAEGQG